VLSDLAIPIDEIVAGGGGEAPSTQRLRHAFADAGWRKDSFEIQKFSNGEESSATSHEIDHVRRTARGTVVLEIEWNNKDPFFDRDLENFKRLHAEGAISAGVVVTRGASLQDGIADLVAGYARRQDVTSVADLARLRLAPSARQKREIAARARRLGDFAAGWATHFCADKFGTATTHWRKLQDRVRRRVGHPCPLLLIGIPVSVVRV
jgi:hypothetical protein